MQHLFFAPSSLYDRGFCEVEHLFLNVFLNKPIPSLFLVLNRIEFIFVKPVHIFDVSYPVVDYSNRTIVHGCLHTSTAIVTADNNMTYLKRVNCKIETAQKVKVCVNNHICDVSVDKNLSWLSTNNNISRHSAVRTSDPKNWRPLSFSLFDEIFRVNCQF